jgi:hypothetical protein
VAAGGESCFGVGTGAYVGGATIAAMAARGPDSGHSAVTTGATVGPKRGSEVGI